MSISGKGRAIPPFIPAQLDQASMTEPTSNMCKFAIILDPQTQVIGAQHGAFPQAGKARAAEAAQNWLNLQNPSEQS